jgi:hypothetical protein
MIETDSIKGRVTHDPRLSFPQASKIRSRNYWRVSDIKDIEKRMVSAALHERKAAT